jgi:hypothetical protein
MPQTHADNRLSRSDPGSKPADEIAASQAMGAEVAWLEESWLVGLLRFSCRESSMRGGHPDRFGWPQDVNAAQARFDSRRPESVAPETGRNPSRFLVLTRWTDRGHDGLGATE